VSVIAYSEILPDSPEKLFDLTQDYSKRAAWDPFPESYEFHGGTHAPAPGVEITVRARNGYLMRVKYVSYVRPRVAAIEMVSGPWFIERFAGAWSFVAESANATKVTFKYNVVAGPRWLLPLLQPLLNSSFSRHARRRLLALKAYVEGASS
jgi:ribosome-associated toxin RatA of RatAB toxin-antitoxin module